MRLRKERCGFCGGDKGYCRCGTAVGRNPDKQALKPKTLRGGKKIDPKKGGKR